MTGCPTGSAQLDERIGGWQPLLQIVAARPGMGKSSMALASADAGVVVRLPKHLREDVAPTYDAMKANPKRGVSVDEAFGAVRARDAARRKAKAFCASCGLDGDLRQILCFWHFIYRSIGNEKGLVFGNHHGNANWALSFCVIDCAFNFL